MSQAKSASILDSRILIPAVGAAFTKLNPRTLSKNPVMGAREAIKHVRGGGVLGIFPEGGLERPARTILPFQAGVGLIIRRTEAPVLPVVVSGTPIADQAWTSLVRFSSSVVTFHGANGGGTPPSPTS